MIFKINKTKLAPKGKSKKSPKKTPNNNLIWITVLLLSVIGTAGIFGFVYQQSESNNNLALASQTPAYPVTPLPEFSAEIMMGAQGRTCPLASCTQIAAYQGQIVSVIGQADGTRQNDSEVWYHINRDNELFFIHSSSLRVIQPVRVQPTSVPRSNPESAQPQSRPQNPVCSCSSNTYDCNNFSSGSQAQACYNYCQSQGVGDIHQLDGDNDGRPCERLR